MSIGIDHAVRLDFLPYDGHQRLTPHVCNWHGVDFAAAFQWAEYDDFSCRSAPTLSFAPTTKITLINFDLTTKFNRPFLLFAGNLGA